MPIDPNIYQNIQPNIAGQLAGSLNQFTEQRGRLSDLARQREMQDVTIQRQEQQFQAQQAEAQSQQATKHKQELNLGISQVLRQGGTPEQALQWGMQESQKRGIDPSLTQQHLTKIFQSGKPSDELANYFEESAYPEQVAKQRFGQRFATQKAGTPSALATLMAEREKIAVANPNAPQLAIYDQMIQKQTTTAPQTQIVVGEGGAMSAITMPKTAGQRPTVTPLGVSKPMTAGKGGTPEEKKMMKEQASLSSQQVLDQAEKLFSHPGRAAGTGASSWMGNIPGTEAKGFQANLETFKSQTFLPMVSALKGMGALSDAEGKKITASVGALDPQMPEKEFEESIKETTRFLFNKAKAAGLNVQMPAFAATSQKTGAHPSDIEAILAKHR